MIRTRIIKSRIMMIEVIKIKIRIEKKKKIWLR